MSRLLRFTGASDQLGIDAYVHDVPRNERALSQRRWLPQKYPLGWYEPASRTVTLRHAFQAPPPDTRGAPPVYEKGELPIPSKDEERLKRSKRER